jgi:hypothetical protein
MLMMPKRMRTIVVSALTLVIGVAIGIFGSRFGERVTLISLAPGDVNRVWLVEVPSFIDRNFTLRIENLEERRIVTIFRSPDEGKPIGSERIIWATDGSRFVLLGRHFYVNQQATLASGERLYLMYDVRSGELWCNSSQQSTYPSFSRKDLSSSEWQGYFDRETR